MTNVRVTDPNLHVISAFINDLETETRDKRQELAIHEHSNVVRSREGHSFLDAIHGELPFAQQSVLSREYVDLDIVDHAPGLELQAHIEWLQVFGLNTLKNNKNSKKSFVFQLC